MEKPILKRVPGFEDEIKGFQAQVSEFEMQKMMNVFVAPAFFVFRGILFAFIG